MYIFCIIQQVIFQKRGIRQNLKKKLINANGINVKSKNVRMSECKKETRMIIDRAMTCDLAHPISMQVSFLQLFLHYITIT